MNNSSSCFVSLELWAPQSNVTCDYLNTAPNANQFHVKEKTFFAFSFFFFLLLLENSNVLSPNNNSENGGIKIESALLCFVVVAFHRSVLVAAALVFEWVWDEWTTGNTCYCCSIAARPQFFFSSLDGNLRGTNAKKRRHSADKWRVNKKATGMKWKTTTQIPHSLSLDVIIPGFPLRTPSIRVLL